MNSTKMSGACAEHVDVEAGQSPGPVYTLNHLTIYIPAGNSIVEHDAHVLCFIDVCLSDATWSIAAADAASAESGFGRFN